ncbi:MAG: transglycosylase SLT domain-containing protein [bacterium]
MMYKKRIISFIIVYSIVLEATIVNPHLDTTYFQLHNLKKKSDLLKQQIKKEKERFIALLKVAEASENNANKLRALNPGLDRKKSIRYGFLIERYSRLRNLDSDLVIAIIAVESGVNFNAVSKANAVGLMQVRPGIWAKQFGLERQSFFDPEINIKIGTFILANNIQRFGGTYEAITAYNYGRDVGPCNYTGKVLETYRALKEKA